MSANGAGPQHRGMSSSRDRCPACTRLLISTRFDATFRMPDQSERLCFGIPGGLCADCHQLYIDPDLIELLDLAPAGARSRSRPTSSSRSAPGRRSSVRRPSGSPPRASANAPFPLLARSDPIRDPQIEREAVARVRRPAPADALHLRVELDQARRAPHRAPGPSTRAPDARASPRGTGRGASSGRASPVISPRSRRSWTSISSRIRRWRTASRTGAGLSSIRRSRSSSARARWRMRDRIDERPHRARHGLGDERLDVIDRHRLAHGVPERELLQLHHRDPALLLALDVALAHEAADARRELARDARAEPDLALAGARLDPRRELALARRLELADLAAGARGSRPRASCSAGPSRPTRSPRRSPGRCPARSVSNAPTSCVPRRRCSGSGAPAPRRIATLPRAEHRARRRAARGSRRGGGRVRCARPPVASAPAGRRGSGSRRSGTRRPPPRGRTRRRPRSRRGERSRGGGRGRRVPGRSPSGRW